MCVAAWKQHGESERLQFSVAPQLGGVDPPDVEVLHVDVPVGGSLPLAPQQQTLLGRGLCEQGKWPDVTICFI